MHSFTIKDLENLSGIKAHTIRIWEQRYSFLKPNRTGTNIRFYTNEELKILWVNWFLGNRMDQAVRNMIMRSVYKDAFF